MRKKCVTNYQYRLYTLKILPLVIFCLLFYLNGDAQESFKKRYYVNDNINYTIESQTDTDDGNKVDDPLELLVIDDQSKIVKKQKILFGQKVIYNDTVGTPKTLENLGIKSKSTWWTKIIIPSRGRLKANVKFDGNKLYINPWLYSYDDDEREKTYYFELKNRQSLKVSFSQWSFNALTVPLKVRFGDKEIEFTTGANLGAFFGYTWGKTNFVHRKKIGNKEYDQKITTGLFLGSDKIEFKFKDQEDTEQTVKTAFISIGSGVLYSYQKITLGITGGFDFAFGDNRKEWDFQGRPWVGATIGYSLFTF